MIRKTIARATEEALWAVARLVQPKVRELEAAVLSHPGELRRAYADGYVDALVQDDSMAADLGEPVGEIAS